MEKSLSVLGEQHPHMLSRNLAFTWKGQGHDEEAIRVMSEWCSTVTSVLEVAYVAVLLWGTVTLASKNSCHAPHAYFLVPELTVANRKRSRQASHLAYWVLTADTVQSSSMV
jgi:hypothetical protein